MSLILDALKRAERERRADAGAVLGDVPPGAPRSRRPAIHLVVLAVLAFAVVAAIVWAAHHGHRAGPSATPVVTRAATPAPQAVAPPPAPATMTPAPAPTPTPIPGTESVGSLDEIAEEPPPEETPAPATEDEEPTPAPPAQPAPQRKPPASAAPTAKAPPPKAETPVPAPPAPAASEPRSQTPAAQAAPAEEAPAAPTAAAPAEKPVPPALTQPASLPRLREMPPEYRADFPALSVDVHVYDRVPSQRFVIVNGRHYREGEQMVEGPRIVEIVKDGIVLDYRGEKVLYTISH